MPLPLGIVPGVEPLSTPGPNWTRIHRTVQWPNYRDVEMRWVSLGVPQLPLEVLEPDMTGTVVLPEALDL